MKNLLTYLHPGKEFTEDHVRIVKIQMENTLRLWKPEDVLLVTNFNYSHAGFEALVVPDDLFCQHRKRASKINVICYLLEKGLLNELCWFHDFDAFQINPISESIIDGYEAGFTDYGFSDKWNTGSFFFTPSSLDIFRLIQKVMNRLGCNEEQALQRITNGTDIDGRYIRLDSAYNLGGNRHVKQVYDKSEKPIRVVHFHPGWGLQFDNVKEMLPDHLIELFAKYDYK